MSHCADNAIKQLGLDNAWPAAFDGTVLRTPAPSVVPIQCKELAVCKTIKMARVPWVRSYQRLARE